LLTFHPTFTTCPVPAILGLSVNVHSRCGSGSVTVTVVVHVVQLSPFAQATSIVYVVVVVGLTDVDQFHVGEVNPENPEIIGENVAFSQLVYHALSVVVCHTSIVDGLALNVQVAPQVFTAGPSVPLQSSLQCPGVPLRSPSSQTSFGSRDRECRSIVSPSTSIPSEFASSITPSPHLAT
jgi:hypothetical protein